MGYRRRAGGGKRDLAEAAICDALQAVGATIWKLSGTGNPDLLVRYRGRYCVAEVKTPKVGRVTPNQVQNPWPIWTTPDEALRAIGATKG